MTVNELAGRCAGWFGGTGAHCDVVVSTRIRLARNLADIPFAEFASNDQLSDLSGRLAAWCGNGSVGRPLTYFDAEEAGSQGRRVLVERHLISPALADASRPRGVAVANDETASVMVNEEDHFRIQTIGPGLDLSGTWEAARGVEADLAGRFGFAFDERWGYLTACPTNAGTGLRASVLAHLPGLALTQELDAAIRAVTQMGYAVRGLHGEGSAVQGNLYQVSNQVTLGRCDADILDGLEQVVHQLLACESRARSALMDEIRIQVEDKVWRAWALVCNARLLTAADYLNLASAIRLGVALGLLQNVEVGMLNKLMVRTKPAHVQAISGRRLEAAERDAVRAEMVRTALAAH